MTLSDLSSLTKVQVETLKIHRAVRKGEISMDNALRMRKTFGISRGTHYRIVDQGKRNIVRSLLTVATAVQMGLLNAEDAQKFISTVSAIPSGVDPEKLPEVTELVRVLAQRIVML